VALPMDEQRILDEMERMLAADDPRLAARLAAFGRPGLSQVLRSSRARMTFALIVVSVVAAVAVVVYLMSAFRLGESQRPQPPRASHPPHRVSLSASAGFTRMSRVSGTSSSANGGLQAHCLTASEPSYCRSLLSAATPEG
jgi:hypothetical protein